ncbi:P-loop containing nucleoside triphosphate hydrolase protein [Sodiomyces alkalinus F11]|uniref:Kinesin-like protein n=1 Tax=Sodiomyces alkalinus (strain CBS 110278 / VKM F-3762 / F11) TaxID=1314773 RepID=A0A3N2Q4B0_SODAK|nr:P-loop containing nucleoside triphosphate hydrolase protein [Sodiomyces alkalinus F11]ROT41445.1 P-loop containing nucleoside triphosphate hydrolase protein [Sodiomyces alkalinus F11]
MASTTTSKSANLFQVYLRLRPPPAGSANSESFLTVESEEGRPPTHIILNPPNDRKRSTEKFAFTQVFEEDASQLDVFQCTGVAPLIEGVLAPHGGEGSDALLATLGVTGSGKTHTILGSRTQRGMTQMTLDVLFRSIGYNMLDMRAQFELDSSLRTSDVSDGSLMSAPTFLETIYSDFAGPSRAGSRAATPMLVGTPREVPATPPAPRYYPSGPGPKSVRVVPPTPTLLQRCRPLPSAALLPKTPPKRAVDPGKHFMTMTKAYKKKKTPAKTPAKADLHHPPATPRRALQRASSVPQLPDVRGVNVSSDPSAEYAVVLSMYEVYNDKIYDLLSPPIRSNATKEYRRRPLLFKSTEQCTDRKVVAGLRKIVCQTLREAIMVLEAGLHERQVAGTGSNSVSSRSHGFFCIEVKKRTRNRRSSSWTTSTFTIVDLAGSERARDAKTQGSTLAEAGKINESLMYLGQCLQAQSGSGNSSKPSVMPFRQCKMTELLFSNSFSTTSSSYTASVVPRRNAQRGVMIVTADPHGDVNATSQILRYSALAREVTIPRIPSITSTLLADTPHSGPPSSHVSHHPSSHTRPYAPQHAGSHRDISASSHGDGDRVIMEHAALEIARMQDDINTLHAELDRERDARVTAEAHLLSMEDRMLELEQIIREDCAAEYEARFDLEVARWKASMAVQQEHSEEHWDRKMELFERGLGGAASTDEGDGSADDDDYDKENLLVENLEEENERLRRELAVLKRELGARSPTRRMPLHERDDYSGGRSNTDVYGGYGGGGAALGSLGQKMEQLRVSNGSTASSPVNANSAAANTTTITTATATGSPKKMRKLVTKRWDDAGDDLS